MLVFYSDASFHYIENLLPVSVLIEQMSRNRLSVTMHEKQRLPFERARRRPSSTVMLVGAIFFEMTNWAFMARIHNHSLLEYGGNRKSVFAD